MLDVVALFSALKMAGAEVYAFRRPEITDRIVWRGGLAARWWYAKEGVDIRVNADLKLAGDDEDRGDLNTITIAANLFFTSDVCQREEILRRGLANFLEGTISGGLQWSISEAPARDGDKVCAHCDPYGAVDFSELAISRGHYTRLRVSPRPQAYMKATELRDDLDIHALGMWTTGLKVYLSEDEIKALKGLPKMENDGVIMAWRRENHRSLASQVPPGHHALIISGRLIASSRMERELNIFCSMLYKVAPETGGTSWHMSPYEIATGKAPQVDVGDIRGRALPPPDGSDD